MAVLAKIDLSKLPKPPPLKRKKAEVVREPMSELTKAKLLVLHVAWAHEGMRR